MKKKEHIAILRLRKMRMNCKLNRKIWIDAYDYAINKVMMDIMVGRLTVKELMDRIQDGENEM